MFENKKKFALWVYPDTLEKVEKIYREDNCESKSEFIEKAINIPRNKDWNEDVLFPEQEEEYVSKLCNDGR